jgi:hypothetical protein
MRPRRLKVNKTCGCNHWQPIGPQRVAPMLRSVVRSASIVYMGFPTFADAAVFLVTSAITERGSGPSPSFLYTGRLLHAGDAPCCRTTRGDTPSDAEDDARSLHDVGRFHLYIRRAAGHRWHRARRCRHPRDAANPACPFSSALSHPVPLRLPAVMRSRRPRPSATGRSRRPSEQSCPTAPSPCCAACGTCLRRCAAAAVVHHSVA